MGRTEARLDAPGADSRRLAAGPWEQVTPRTDWVRVDATTEAGIERQAAFDDAEAARDAAAWGRVRRCAALSQAVFARRIGISVASASPPRSTDAKARVTAIEINGADARLQLATIELDIALAAIYRGVPGLSPG